MIVPFQSTDLFVFDDRKWLPYFIPFELHFFFLLHLLLSTLVKMNSHPGGQVDLDVNARPSSTWRVPKYLIIKNKVHILSRKDLIK